MAAVESCLWLQVDAGTVDSKEEPKEGQPDRQAILVNALSCQHFVVLVLWGLKVLQHMHAKVPFAHMTKDCCVTGR